MYFKKAVLCFILPFVTFSGSAQGQLRENIYNIALKSGESTELTNLFFIASNCKSLLKSTPEVEILDGPPGVTAVVHAASVIPHAYSCAKPVRGGALVITAKDIQEYSQTQMLLRVKLKTSLGDRQVSLNVNIALLPME